MDLRKICDEVGREIEGWEYERLRQPAEVLSFARSYDGHEVYFSLEAYEENRQGDLHICVDCSAPTIQRGGWLPSYVFWKRPDGSVYADSSSG